MPHERLQRFVIIDYTKEMTILAVIRNGSQEDLVGIGQYSILEATHTAEVAFAVRDDHQNKGIGGTLLSYSPIWQKDKALGFPAEC